MARSPSFRSADLARALKAMQQAGLTISRVEITLDGNLTIACDSDGRDLAREEARRALEDLRKRIQADNADRRAKRAERQASKDSR